MVKYSDVGKFERIKLKNNKFGIRPVKAVYDSMGTVIEKSEITTINGKPIKENRKRYTKEKTLFAIFMRSIAKFIICSILIIIYISLIVD